MTEIIGLGGLVYDFICQVETLPARGETTLARDLKFNIGGKSANSVVQASLLGDVKTAVVGKVGEDQYGRDQLEDLRSYGVNTDHVKLTHKEPSSMAFVTIDATGRNHIVLASGADKLVSPTDIAECYDLIAKSKVLISNFEIPMDACVEAIAVARKHRVTTILVPAPVPAGFTADLLPQVDILCPNEVEAGQMLNMHIDSVESATEAIKRFYDLGNVRHPIVTMGSMGAMVGIRPGVVKMVNAPKVDSIDSTGAGDSFVGSLAYLLVKEPSLSIDMMVSRAVFIASMSTTRKGTRPSYVSSTDLS